MRNSLILISLLSLVAACGDGPNAGGPQGADSSSFGGFGDTTLLPDGAPAHPDDVDEPGDGNLGQEPSLEIILLHDTSFPIQLLIQDELIIRAKVVDYGAGAPASDQDVSFKIVKNEGQNGMAGDAQLAAKVAFTDEQGQVQNTFKANFVGDVDYTVRLSTPGANDVFLDIQVSDTPKGALEVTLDYEGPINVNTVKVRLMPTSFLCGTFLPTKPISGSLADKTVLNISDKPFFDGLAGGSHFTLVATAKSPTGTLAAAGCKDGVFVVANTTVKTTLELHLLPLNPTGSYDVDNYFDFTNALGEMGTVGDVIGGIVTLFNDPGAFLIDQIKTLVKQWLGELLVDTVFGLFEDELAKVITDWVKNDSPAWVQDFFTVGDDLTQIVDNLHLISVLKISKLQNDYYFQGTQFWNGIILSWKINCGPNDPPDCGDLKFTLEDLSNTEFPQDILEGHFTGSVVNYNQLFIDQHTIQLSYGKLILFVLNEVILKSITGQDNLKDAVLQFVNCTGLASTFSNSILDALGLPEDKLAKFCESTIGLLIAPLEAWIGSLALDSQLRLSGQCTLVDETDDLYIDKLIDGKYSGLIDINGGAGPPFSGTFSGIKQPIAP